MPVIREFVRIWDLCLEVQLTEEQDAFIWKWSPSGRYSVSSTYTAFFHGQAYLAGGKELWKSRAPLKCKFFFWLALY